MLRKTLSRLVGLVLLAGGLILAFTGALHQLSIIGHVATVLPGAFCAVTGMAILLFPQTLYRRQP